MTGGMRTFKIADLESLTRSLRHALGATKVVVRFIGEAPNRPNPK